MKLIFTVDITVDISDQAVADTLVIPLTGLPHVTNDDLSDLAIGAFGDLQLVRGLEPEGRLGKVTDYATGDFVGRVS